MDNIGYILMKVSKELRYNLTTDLKAFGLTTSQWAVLKRLQIEEACGSTYQSRTAVEIAAALDFDKPTISGILSRLFDKRMIKKEQHPSDRRVVILSLTEEARKIIPTIEKVSDTVIEQSLINFTTGERETFLTLLRKLDRTLCKGR
ncbi:MarR family transcriptional regulator [Neobacillus sp. DY30]|uniref:MarR family winged helix-turn-helix transcriptional regulator n=1 Tax=Neobacillus sp. DY30 TaxID=3047871 RepID=UPI0024BF1C9A|nr:MarR family transcriptional regulator [Neobacillus sp. DY30]WHX98725.1 MarR family transcriptional regulator [Neobacillus sp. DY30]